MWQNFLEILPYLWGPIVGAVIGYFTNYLAVKMLFHPYNPVYIGKCKLPFTPGIIPKRKEALAKTIGDAVANHLLTDEDIKEMFLAEKTKKKMVDVVMESLDLSLAFTVTEEPLKSTSELMQEYLTPAQWSRAKNAVTGFLTDRILTACAEMDVGKMIAERGVEMLREKKGSLGMLSLLVNETTIHAFAPRISEKVNTYIAENGKRQIGDAILLQIEQYSERPIHDIVALISEDQIANIIGIAYEKLISGIIMKI